MEILHQADGYIIDAPTPATAAAPAFNGEGPLVVGVVSWTTAASDEDGGGLTGVTPLLD